MFNIDDMTTDKALSGRIATLKREFGILQNDLAETAGVSPQAVVNWMKRDALSRTSAERIAARYGLSLDWLLIGKGPIKASPTAIAAGMVSESMERTAYAVGQIIGSNGKPVESDIAQRLPLINLSEANQLEAAIRETMYSVPIWRRPGSSAARPYTDEAFAVLIDTDQYAPTILKDSVLFVEPNSVTGHNGWCLVTLPNAKSAIFKAISGINPSTPGLQSVLSQNAPVEPWPAGAKIIGTIVYVLPA